LKNVVAIPTYNEAENLPKLVSALFTSAPELEILVIDDNSPDGTGQIAEQLGQTYNGRVHVIHRAGKLGLGTAYIQAFHWVIENGYDAVCQMDCDFSHPPEKLPELIKALETCDIAVGSRYVPGGRLDDKWPLWRKALSGWGNFYARTILGLKQHDVTGGFRLWSIHAVRAMPLDRLRSTGYIFQVECAYVANKLGLTYKEIPIYFAERTEGTSKMSFRIQMEAAFRVWGLPSMYRDLKPVQ
jgi:dolichol-phosphate mannosyltransferase